MHRYVLLAGIFALPCFALLPPGPAFAVTAKQKMATCVFGADHPNGSGPKLVGKERKQFIDRCMSNKNDPRGPAAGAPATEGKTRG